MGRDVAAGMAASVDATAILISEAGSLFGVQAVRIRRIVTIRGRRIR